MTPTHPSDLAALTATTAAHRRQNRSPAAPDRPEHPTDPAALTATTITDRRQNRSLACLRPEVR
jgi:hypothetical protein